MAGVLDIILVHAGRIWGAGSQCGHRTRAGLHAAHAYAYAHVHLRLRPAEHGVYGMTCQPRYKMAGGASKKEDKTKKKEAPLYAPKAVPGAF